MEVLSVIGIIIGCVIGLCFLAVIIAICKAFLWIIWEIFCFVIENLIWLAFIIFIIVFIIMILPSGL